MESIKQSRLRRFSWKKLLLRGLMLLIAVVAVTLGWLHWQLRSSLPKLSGELLVEGLSARVTIERDALGVPTVTSTSRVDTALALGFLHAQDRFFQMDLLRRMSAGKLAELLGQGVVGVDESFRKHRFQRLATAVINALPNHQRQVMTAYTRGVNHGLACLDGKPFEYLLLRQKPEAWKNEDCILVMMTMLCDLQHMDAEPEIGFGILRERVPTEVFDFLVRSGSEWDAALDGSTLEVPPIPPADVWSLRGASPEAGEQATAFAAPTPNGFPFPQLDPEFRVGSNNWAVSGNLGREGLAILASDMHLGLRVPATWYRAVMKTPTTDGKVRRLVGVTLPGTPTLVEGSNGSIAWGFTNSYGDFGDVVELKLVPGKSDEYLTRHGPAKLQSFSEEISFVGGSKTIEYQWSIWGPVVDRRDGRVFVHRWIGNDPQAFDMQAMELESAANTEAALDVANQCGLPHVNIVVADREGHIGWTLCGRVPRRSTAPSVVPADWSAGIGEWQGFLDPEEYPRVLNPADGRLWTANNRILGDDFLKTIGDGRFALGARARQIRDRLRERQTFSETDLLAIQLDDEAIFLQHWQALLLETSIAKPDSVSPKFIKAVEEWGQRASTPSVGYRIVSEFRIQVIERLFGVDTPRRKLPTAGAFSKKTGIRRFLFLAHDDVVSQLLRERPLHWLPDEYASWDDLLVAAAKSTEAALTKDQSLKSATWGARNRAKIQHPLSMALPFLAGWLDMPAVELPGDNHMPRVQSPSGGASQRMVVSPGQEERGIYHQPGGQSGHPFSPFYRSGFDDWAAGNASSLLPGTTQHTLTLVPGAEN